MEQCKANLSAWNDSEFGHVGRNTMELQTKLEWLELQLVSNEILEVLRHTQIELNCWLDRENDMWRQRSMINWFQMVIGTQASFMPRHPLDKERISCMVY